MRHWWFSATVSSQDCPSLTARRSQAGCVPSPQKSSFWPKLAFFPLFSQFRGFRGAGRLGECKNFFQAVKLLSIASPARTLLTPSWSTRVRPSALLQFELDQGKYGSMIPGASAQSSNMKSVRVIDSHTGGEPTRIVVSEGPDLGRGPLASRLENFRRHHDHFRSAVVNEPRGSEVLVGALMVEPLDPSCVAGVIFFNNVGYLGMCGHGTIGLMATLAHQGRIQPGHYRIETPVGIVAAELHKSGEVSVQNVPSYRHAKAVRVTLGGDGAVTGDIAWGGNWFFLVNDHGKDLALSNVEALTEFTWRIRQALKAQGISGRDGHEIDHIELFGPSSKAGVPSKNFVLCPGKAYDRSPCGTGTSAKLACLVADHKLKEGEVWRQESITGSIFEGSIKVVGDQVIPTIKGSAFVNAESTLILNPNDPCCWGLREAAT